jgi:predicted short-subunit dehydrogenase-like oxidoreductase (DUF2520 family)
MDSEQSLLERPWIIIGAGRLGRTLGLLAERVGANVAATWNRSRERAEDTERVLGGDIVRAYADVEDALASAGAPRVVWLTVVDDAVAEVASRIRDHVGAGDIAVHTSGVASSAVLREAGLERCAVGSIHVLQAVTEPERAVDALGDATWSVEGDPEVVDFARELLGRIGVDPLVIEADAKVLYHASAVTAANLMVALMDAAFEMAQSAGLSRDQARKMLLPLTRSSLENLSEQDTSSALSGPVARGDRETIERHREALAALEDANLTDVYAALTERAKRLAVDAWSDSDEE